MVNAAAPYFYIVLGLALLYFGAQWLVNGGVKLALKLGVKPLFIGLTVVAFGTSAPELVVSVQSTLEGVGNIAVGNVIGSNICNIALILGLSAVICKMRVSAQLFKFDVPVMLVFSLLAVFFLFDNLLAFWESVALLAVFAAYVAYGIIIARRGAQTQAAASATNEVAEIVAHDPKPVNIVKCLSLIAAGLAMLVLGADRLVAGAVSVAQSLGVSDAIIGLTIVAVGTSLPELAASVVAALKKQNDIAVGNIVGSNIFNIAFILGVAGVISPIEAKGIENRDIFTMLALSAALFVPFFTKQTLTRITGIVFLAAYVAYIAFLVRA